MTAQPTRNGFETMTAMEAIAKQSGNATGGAPATAMDPTVLDPTAMGCVSWKANGAAPTTAMDPAMGWVALNAMGGNAAAANAMQATTAMARATTRPNARLFGVQ